MQKLWTLAILASSLLVAAAPPKFELRDTKGVVHRADEWRGKQAVVLFFMMTDCPLANGYVPEMNRLRGVYEPRGIAFYAVQSDNTVSDAVVQKYAQEFGYGFPVLNDPRLTLARFTGAKVTPEVAILSPAGEVLYLGGSTTRWRTLRVLTYRMEPELRNAIEAVGGQGS
jgi:peroxiredoxin